MAAAPGTHADALTSVRGTETEGTQANRPPSLFEQMRRDGFRFDFYQAVALLERRAERERLRDGLPKSDRVPVRFRPSNALSFPASDVRRIEIPESPGDVPTVVATFMGLYGVDAPLPSYFVERIAIDEGSATELRDFLDLFAQRFYELFYRAWKRVRPEMDERGTHAQRFRAVAGLAGAPSAPDQAIDPATLVPLAGLLARRARGADGLSSLLRTLLGLPVRIEQFVPRWVHVPRTSGIGRGARLDGHAMLGERLFDLSGKFRIWLGPMDLDRYLSLLPGGSEARVVNGAVRAYVPGYLDFDLVLQLRTAELQGVRLGDRRSRLGLTTCLGRPSTPILERILAQP